MFKDYKILVSGATSGMGLAVTKKFLDDGATVIGLGRNFSRTTELGENFIPFTCEITDEAQIIKAVKFAADKFGGVLDVLVCNAGKAFYGSADNVATAEIEACDNLFIRAPMILSRECLPLLQKSEHASIIHNASIAALTIVEQGYAYAVAKAALVNYTRQSAAVFGKVRVNAVCPGFIRTGLFTGEAWDAVAASDDVKDNIPAGRLGKPEEVADLMLFLASEKAGFISGAVITIDGGYRTTHPRA